MREGRKGMAGGSFRVELRRRRTAAGMSLAELARRVNYSKSYLSKIETGDKPAGAELAKRCDMALSAAGMLAGLVTNGSPRPARRMDTKLVPRQLPAAVRGFVGRAVELDRLSYCVDRRCTAVAIVGSAGVGKTALAVQWARLAVDRFPDGQLYVNLRGFGPHDDPTRPGEALRRFLYALRVSPDVVPSSVDAQAELFRSLTDDRRLLVVLDNVADAEQVRILFPGGPGCFVLLTSRRRLTSLVAREHVEHLPLQRFASGDARALVEAVLDAENATDTGAVDELICRCDGLPLALSIGAARVVADPHLSLESLVTQLREERSILATLSTSDSVDTDLRAVFSWSQRALSDDAKRLFRLFGLHPGPDAGIHAAASLAGVSVECAAEHIEELSQAHLLEQPSLGRFWCHDLLRAYAVELVHQRESAELREAAARRLLDHYLQTAYAAARLLNPARDSIPLPPAADGVTSIVPADYPEALAWFEAEFQVLMAVIRSAATRGFDAHVGPLVWTLDTFFPRRGHWHEQLIAQRLALAVARRAGDVAGLARAHRGLGRAHEWLNHQRSARAHYERARKLYAELGDLVGQGHCSRGLAWAAERAGDYDSAIVHAEHALAQFRAAGHRAGEVRSLNVLGWSVARAGRYRDALGLCERALERQPDDDDRHAEAAILGNIGYCHHHLGDYAEAMSYYRSALALVSDLDDLYSQALVLRLIGDMHSAAGEPSPARDAWRQSLAILDRLGHPDAVAVRASLDQPHPAR